MREYREFAIEEGLPVDREPLTCSFVPPKEYEELHEHSVVACADVLVKVGGDYLLIKRNEPPLKNELWLYGGMVRRGVSLEDFLKEKVELETGLRLGQLIPLQHNRAFLKTSKFDHPNGTDTISPVYLAKGVGDIRLDETHCDYELVSPDDDAMMAILHPFVREVIDVAEGRLPPGRIREYATEDSMPVDIKNLEAGFIPDDVYQRIHMNSCVMSSDALVYHPSSEGFVIVKRETVPIAGEWWFTGGRIPKGVKLEDAICGKVKKECGLDADWMVPLHFSREFYRTDPLGHGKGTDTFGYKMVALGEGDLEFDGDHSDIRILKPGEYPAMRDSFLPLLRHTLDIAIAMMGVAEAQGISFEEYLRRNARREELVFDSCDN